MYAIRSYYVIADLDDFKRYNTDFGHDCGDLLLRAAGKRVAATVRAGDICARTAGDEFGVLMPVRSSDESHEAAARVQAAFGEPISLDGKSFGLRASLGVAVWPRDGANAVITSYSIHYTKLYEEALLTEFRDFARLPEPQKAWMELKPMVDEAVHLYSASWPELSIDCGAIDP